MKLFFGDGWNATVTDDPLLVHTRFTGNSVDVAPYASVKERERFIAGTFGSQDWLWDIPDVLRFDPDSRKLVGAEFQMPYVSADAEVLPRVPAVPAARPGGLRADEVRDFRQEMCTVLCRAPGDAVLTCLRDLKVLDEPLEARIGIAPDVALLVQHGTVVGWSLTDPARHLTTVYAAPDPAPPSPATRRLLSSCLDLITDPLLEEVQDREPAALARLREVHQALRSQREDRHRVDALLTLIGNLVEDYGGR
ncbi:hypothetical protein [Streptomyces viridosporus]|uniref:Uncharacterized protein n=1 Tax=Streptomyces viridosporus T7A TaxID=665577 RepID=A0ABX6ANJ5_STRVD|nr:hypothetical protein [Streptomyces viridosporus]QEU88745.1 hypothetical protein CP969_31710 [Streptomyces viridosporus T7A]